MYYNTSKSEFCTHMFLSAIACFVLFLISPLLPLHNEMEKDIFSVISLAFTIFFIFQFLISLIQIQYLHVIQNNKLSKEKIISAIKSQNAIAELGYEDGILTHLSCEIEIDGTEIIVEFEVPTNKLDISNEKFFDATKLTDYITEFS